MQIGITTPVCGVSNFGEYPETAYGYCGLREFVALERILAARPTARIISSCISRPGPTPPGEEVAWPDVARACRSIEAALGPPVFIDDNQIVVFTR